MKTCFFFYNLCKHDQLGRLEQPPQKKKVTKFFMFSTILGWHLTSEFMICCWFWCAPQNWWQVAFFCQQMQEENPETIRFKKTYCKFKSPGNTWWRVAELRRVPTSFSAMAQVAPQQLPQFGKNMAAGGFMQPRARGMQKEDAKR